MARDHFVRHLDREEAGRHRSGQLEGREPGEKHHPPCRGKLGRADTLPLAPALRGYLEGSERPRDPKAKVFPIAAKQSLARLNDEFRGLAAKVGPEVWGFDALRLTLAYRLEWESIPGIAQMLGHQSSVQGLVYTCTDKNTLKVKLAQLRIAQPKPERKGGLKP